MTTHFAYSVKTFAVRSHCTREWAIDSLFPINFSVTTSLSSVSVAFPTAAARILQRINKNRITEDFTPPGPAPNGLSVFHALQFTTTTGLSGEDLHGFMIHSIETNYIYIYIFESPFSLEVSYCCKHNLEKT